MSAYDTGVRDGMEIARQQAAIEAQSRIRSLQLRNEELLKANATLTQLVYNQIELIDRQRTEMSGYREELGYDEPNSN